MPFCSGKSRFWSKPKEGKGEFAATPNLTPVARRVAACGLMWGLAGRRWGTDTTQPIWARVGELFGAPKAKQEKGVGSCPPPPRSLLPTVRAVAEGLSPGSQDDFFGRRWGQKQKKSCSCGKNCGVTTIF